MTDEPVFFRMFGAWCWRWRGESRYSYPTREEAEQAWQEYRDEQESKEESNDERDTGDLRGSN